MKLGQQFFGSRATFPSRSLGTLTVESASFSEAIDGDLVVYFGKPFEAERPLVRIHSECVFAEVFDSDLCDCADQLRTALCCLEESRAGILFYLRIDGRGAGLAAKVAATALEVTGKDTYQSRLDIGVPPEGRDFRSIGRFLIEKGISRIRLLTNSPVKAAGVTKAGVDVELAPLIVNGKNPHVKALLATKRDKFGHLIPRTIS